MSKQHLLRVAITAFVATGVMSSTAHGAHLDFRVNGLTADGLGLVTFEAKKPQKATDPVTITGLAAGERIVGIDVRPANGQLTALSSASKLYVLAPDGTATLKSTLTIPLDPAATLFDIDFNPTVDRLRVVNDADQNLRVNVDTGAVTNDLALNYAATDAFAGTDPTIAGVAYTNNDNDGSPTTSPAGTGTTLYDIDSALDILAVQSPPNNGTLSTVGELRKDAEGLLGFDIHSTIVDGHAVAGGDVALAAFGKEGSSGTDKLYEIDLESGKAKKIHPFGHLRVSDIAVVQG